MDFLRELAQRADIGSWEQWSIQYRVLAVVVGLLVAYWALRVLIPVMLGVLRPFFFLGFVLAAVWALFPAEVCSIELLARIPVVCAR
mgnify:CR=1 FL=1